jgi:hypothetical protein
MKPSPPSIGTSSRFEDLNRLREFHLFDTRFRHESLRACGAMIEETRAWVNSGLIEVLHNLEERDRARFGRTRQRWEKKFEDPQDVFIKADRMKRPSAAGKPGL